jgi:hypothetical protein
MTQEQNDLLLKDLSARLSYGVICNTSKGNGHLCSINQTIFGVEYGINIKATERDYFDNEEIIKPYLFPMSNMTEEQYKEYLELEHSGNMEHLSLPLLEWLNKNNFDYRGLIPKGLAIDATGLNIYWL